MLIYIPQTAEEYGFILEGMGAHGSRTIMLSELRSLFAICPKKATLDDYRKAVIEGNVLLKNTDSTRQESIRRLRELYSLNKEHVIFRTLRDLWDHEQDAQPFMAALCVVARDPLFRVTSEVIINTPPENSVTPQMISLSIKNQFPGRLNDTSLANIGRHAASSWKQSGHLRGRSKKVRVQAECHPTSVAYALLLGHLCGAQGASLFQTGWAKLLDSPDYILRELVVQASRQGWLEYRHTGQVTEISFRYLLGEESFE